MVPGGIETFTAATRRGTTCSVTELCTFSTLAVMTTIPGVCAITVPCVSSTVAISGAFVCQRIRTPGIVSPDQLRADARSVISSPASIQSGGARIATLDTYGLGTGSGSRFSFSGTPSRARAARTGCPSSNGAAPSSASACCIDGQRSAGSLASIRTIAASSSGGQSRRSSRIGGTGRSVCACITTNCEPENGGRPVTIS